MLELLGRPFSHELQEYALWHAVQLDPARWLSQTNSAAGRWRVVRSAYATLELKSAALIGDVLVGFCPNCSGFHR